MANRGRPPKKDVLQEASAEARAQGKSYGQLMAEKQREAVKVQQDDGVKRETMKDRFKHIPQRSLHGHHVAIKEIQEEIEVHENCIEEQQKEVDYHMGLMKTHRDAVNALKNELKEEQDFLAAFEA